MKTIAFDIMGNDNGIRAGIEAALDFTDGNLDFIVTLVGDKVKINKYIKETERIRIIDSPNIVNASSGARAARTKDNSMSVAINLVKNGKADAVLSSGDSGIYLSMATLTLKRMAGIKRPAFMPVFPTIVANKRFVMMDVGANLDTTSEMLVQWAQMGNVFAKNILGIKNPRIGVVNIGTEDKKGFEFHKEANNILKKSKLNYKGFVESRDLLNNSIDVAVTDGYAGNMILKTMEGTVLSLFGVLKKNLKSKTKWKLGASIAKGAFKQTAEQLDYRNVGSAWLMGLNHLALKSHGGSDKKAYIGAFNQLAEALNKDALTKIKKELGK